MATKTFDELKSLAYDVELTDLEFFDKRKDDNNDEIE